MYQNGTPDPSTCARNASGLVLSYINGTMRADVKRPGTQGDRLLSTPPPDDAFAVPSGPGGQRFVVERFQALVSVAESITSCREPEELFRRLASQLQRVVTFDFLGLVRYEPEQGVTRPWVLETASMMFTTRLELPIEEHPAGWVIETGTVTPPGRRRRTSCSRITPAPSPAPPATPPSTRPGRPPRCTT